MSSLVQLIEASYSIEIPEESFVQNEEEIPEESVLQNVKEIKTPEQEISGIPGVYWYVSYRPFVEKYTKFVSAFLYLTRMAPIDVRFVSIEKSSDITEEHSRRSEIKEGFGRRKLVSHEVFRKSGDIKDGKFEVTWNVAFAVPVKELEPLPPIYDLLIDACPQIVFEVENRTVEINKGILTSISPVFNAMFCHDTKEAQTGCVKVDDFDYDTIVGIKNFCIGKKLGSLATYECIEMLIFADKYDIKGLQRYLESLLINNITEDNICELATYGWMYSRNNVTTNCARYIAKLGPEFDLTTVFADSDPDLVASLVNKSAKFRNKYNNKL